MARKKQPIKKRSPGRPQKLQVDAKFLATVERLASRGLTLEQIAQSVGIATCTLYEYKLKYPELSERHKKGQAKGIEEVTNALFNKGVNEGDTTAMIFYLKNRAPEDWKDRKEIRQENVNMTPEQWLEVMADARNQPESDVPEDSVPGQLH